MTGSRGRPDADGCFVCGPANPIGLKLAFRLEGEVCRSEFTPQAVHQGYDGVTHGGILFSALDDVMANWLFLRGARAYTARGEIRYREPVPVGTPLILEGRLKAAKGRFVTLRGLALRAGDGGTVAESESVFHVVDPGRGGWS
ncbi:MAG: PaaI family thioesterase [Candidatus Tectomicrobia bacterium]|uniref:PaaI family thioesterase n=1 Tax=Tectimicrobiota bacterium TaxID=2528274 RepID=A0A932HX87_UNCTE|nr:PaaI family thioesterase [Candidatus Tectomicrobia bacterium]